MVAVDYLELLGTVRLRCWFGDDVFTNADDAIILCVLERKRKIGGRVGDGLCVLIVLELLLGKSKRFVSDHVLVGSLEDGICWLQYRLDLLG